MRRFHSYGPVDKDIHFAVPLTDLVTDCLNHIIGAPDKCGHYFTIYAPRQTGKIWLMREVKQRIEQDYPGHMDFIHFVLIHLWTVFPIGHY